MGGEKSIVNQLNVALPYDPEFWWGIHPKELKTGAQQQQKKMCTNVHSITVPNSQKLETTQMSIKG